MMSGMKFANGPMFKAAMMKAGKNVGRALPMTLTNCAFDGRTALMQKGIPKYINKPTPFTTRGVRYSKAKYNVKNPFSTVYFMPVQWRYMKYSVIGGTRRGHTLSVGVDASRNSYGNVVAGQREGKQRHKSDYFRANIGGHDGLWHRSSKGGLRLSHVYKSSINYTKRLPMESLVYREAARVFPVKFRANIKKLLKKATGF